MAGLFDDLPDATKSAPSAPPSALKPTADLFGDIAPAGSWTDNLRDPLAGALKIGPTAVKGVADIARLLTGDTIGGGLSDSMQSGMRAIDQAVGSDRLRHQQQQVANILQSDEFGMSDIPAMVADNPRAAVDAAISTIGSMFLPTGAAVGATRALPSIAKVAPIVARVAPATVATGTTIATGAAQNAAETFADTEGEALGDRYKGAAISGAISAALGGLMGGGAEGLVARRLAGESVARGAAAAAKSAATTGAKEFVQEFGEEGGNTLSKQVARGEDIDPQAIGKQGLYGGIIGMGVGGASDVATNVGNIGAGADARMLARELDQAAQEFADTPVTAGEARSLFADLPNAPRTPESVAETVAGNADGTSATQGIEQQNQAAVSGQQPAPGEAARAVGGDQQAAGLPDAGSAGVEAAGVDHIYAGLSAIAQAESKKSGSIADGRKAMQAYITENADAFANEAIAKAKQDEWGFNRVKNFYEKGEDQNAIDYLAKFVAKGSVLGNDAFKQALKEKVTSKAVTPETGNATPSQSAQAITPEAGKQPVLQNRDRSTPGSVTQMQSIAADPDYGRLGFSRDFANGAPVVAGGQEVPELQLGRQDVAVASDGRRIPVQYAVVEAGDVLPSNQVDGAPNADYATATDRMRAIAGNGRIAGLQAAHQRGTGRAYVDELLADNLHGINPDVVRGMRQPVLVRIMPTSEVTADIGDVSNTVGNLDLSAVEQARNDAQRVDLDALQFAEDGGITAEAARAFVRGMPQAEHGALLDTNGQPTRQAIDRLNAAVFSRAYGNDGLVRLYAQAQDPEARLVLSALARLAPKMARLEGAGALDFRDVVAQAAELAVNARRAGRRIADAAAQMDMAADPMVGVVLDLFARNPRSNREAIEQLGRAADMAYAEANKADTDMFGTVPKASRADVFKQMEPATNEQASPQNLEQPQGAGPVQVAVDRPADQPAAPADTGRAEAGRPTDTLTSYTAEEITARQDAQAKAQADQARADREADQRAQADRERDEFTLTGSDRAADANANQGQMFSKAAPFTDAADAQTGQPMRVYFSRNKVSSKGNDAAFGDVGRDVEPAGEYMNIDSAAMPSRSGWDSGVVEFSNPLVLEHKDTTSQGWKRDLSEMFGGKTGKALSDAVKRAGYDGIVTRDKYGYSETVNLSGKKTGAQFSESTNASTGNTPAAVRQALSARFGKTIAAMERRGFLKLWDSYAQFLESNQGAQGRFSQSARFSEDNRLSNLNPNGASWQRIRENNPALRDKSADDEITIYRATIGDTIRPDDFVAVDKSTLRTELRNVRARDGKDAKIISQKVKVRDLLMGNDATEFVYFPQQFSQASGVQGMYDGKTVHLFADGIARGDEVGVFLHEAGEHASMEAMLGDRYAGLVARANELVRDGDPDALAAQGRIPSDTAPSARDSELLAYMIETVANKKPLTLTAKARRWLADVVAGVRAWWSQTAINRKLEQYGQGIQLTPADIAALAERAVYWQENQAVYSVDQALSATEQEAQLSKKSTAERDAAYMAAVEAGDMETAQRLVNEAAEATGYSTSDSYRMQHRAPNSEDDVSLADMRDSDLVPADYWTKPRMYLSDQREFVAHSKITDLFRQMDARKANGKNPAGARMTVYRAIPKDVKDSRIRNGDWVTPSESYARDEGAMIPEGFRVISQVVTAGQLYWDGNSAAELGYDDGKTYGYKNTKNNRKLLDAVTRDDDGNVVPLNKRFNSRNDDVRFSKSARSSTGGNSNSMQSAAAPWTVPEPGTGDAFIRAIQNNKIDLKRLRDTLAEQYGPLPSRADAYLSEELYHGKIGARVDQLRTDYLEPLLGKIAVAGKNAGVTVDDVNLYLHARHAPERNAAMQKINPGMANNGALSGMSDAQAAATMARFAADGKDAALKAIAADVDQLLTDTRTNLVADGLEDAGVVQAWEAAYKHYVPLQREAESQGSGASKGMGFSVKGPEAKRAVGSNREVVNILANIVAQAETAAIRAEKAEVGRTLLEMARTYPNPEFWKVDVVPTKPRINKDTGLVERNAIDPLYKSADNVVVVKGQGQEHFIVFNKKSERALSMARAVKNIDVAPLPRVLRIVGNATRFLSAMYTARNPEFWMTNFARDVQAMGLQMESTKAAGLQAEVVKSIPKAIGGYRNYLRGEGRTQWARYADELRKAGGTTGYMDSFENSDKRMEDIRKQIDRISQKDYDPRKVARNVLEIVEDYSEIIENGIRLAVFQASRNAGIDSKQAASIAKNITVNFNRKGNWTAGVNSIYMFFNAAVQGSSRMLETLAKSKRIRYVAGGAVVLGFILDALNRAISDDDEETGKNAYDMIPDSVKERNWILMNPLRPTEHIKIPMPLGWNIFPNVGRLAADAATRDDRKKPIEYAAAFGSILMNSLNPLGDSPSVGQFVAPSVLKPVVQLDENKAFHGGPIYKSSDRGFGSQDVRPAFNRHFENTPEVWRATSRALNDMSGGDNVKPGAINIEPDIMRHVFYTVAGGAGRILDQTIDTTQAGAQGKEVTVNRLPFVGKLYGVTDDRQRERVYYDDKKRVEQAKASFDYFNKNGRRDLAREIAEELGNGDYSEGLKMMRGHKGSSAALKKINSQIKREMERADSGEDRAEQLKALRKRRTEMMSRTVNRDGGKE